MFIGYPRSRHSIVASMLDAHPEIIIPHMYNVLTNFRKLFYQSSTLEKNLVKYQLFLAIHQQSTLEAMFSTNANPSYQLRNKQGYCYHVPGSWQGGYQERIKVR